MKYASTFLLVAAVLSAQALKPGTPAPPIAAPPLDAARPFPGWESFRGNFVIVDFWATWCGPCRMQMPKVDMLSREFRNKGLVVFAINEGESVAAANAYLKKNRYTTMALLDGDQAVGRSYQVTGIPTLFVIDRRGTIVAHYVGVHTEESLRAALKKAGIQ